MEVIKVFWFFLPAGIANMAPVLAKFLRLPATPIDLGKKLNGQPIFGPHKTYRGLALGGLAAVGTVYLQKRLYPHTASISLIDYSTVNVWQLGLLQGFGALLGDLIKSFVKRRLGKTSGQSWVPFDQLDWIAGAAIFSSALISLSLAQVIIALLLFGALHPLVNLAGYGLRIKPNRF